MCSRPANRRRSGYQHDARRGNAICVEAGNQQQQTIPAYQTIGVFMKVRECMRALVELDPEAEVLVLNINSNVDETEVDPFEIGHRITSTVALDDGVVAVYYSGPKPVVDDEG